VTCKKQISAVEKAVKKKAGKTAIKRRKVNPFPKEKKKMQKTAV
jgi:hypothetical protein